MPRDLSIGEGATVIFGVNNARDITIAKETAVKESEKIIEKINPITPEIPNEILQALKKLEATHLESETNRTELIENIEEVEGRKGSLRRKLDKTDEERDELNQISNQIVQINQKLDDQEKKVSNELVLMRNQVSEVGNRTVTSIVSQLEEQNAKLARDLVLGNRELFELMESTSLSLNSRIGVQKQDTERIVKLLDLSDHHLKTVFSIIDGQSAERKSYLKRQVIETLAGVVTDDAENPNEIANWLNSVFNAQENPNNRIAALKSFFDKSKKWIAEHPSTVNALKLVLTGIMTYTGTKTVCI